MPSNPLVTVNGICLYLPMHKTFLRKITFPIWYFCYRHDMTGRRNFLTQISMLKVNALSYKDKYQFRIIWYLHGIYIYIYRLTLWCNWCFTSIAINWRSIFLFNAKYMVVYHGGLSTYSTVENPRLTQFSIFLHNCLQYSNPLGTIDQKTHYFPSWRHLKDVWSPR